MQFDGLLILDYILDLFTSSPKSEFTTAEILVVLNLIKNDPDLFDPDVILAYEEAVKDIP